MTLFPSGRSRTLLCLLSCSLFSAPLAGHAAAAITAARSLKPAASSPAASPADPAQPVLLSAAPLSDWMNQALALFSKGDYPAAIALWTQVIMGNPPLALRNEALINRSKAYLVLSQPALAIADLEACSFQPNQVADLANLWLLKGTAQLQLQRYADAIQSFNTAERLQKRNPLLYTNRAVAYQSLGKLKEARADLQASIALDPKISSYFNLAVLERYSGNYPLCYALLDQIIKQSSTYGLAYVQRGICAAALGRHEKAVDDMLKALALDPGNVDAMEQMGLSWAALGKTEPARAYLLKASSIRLAMGQVDQYQKLLKIISGLGSR